MTEAVSAPHMRFLHVSQPHWGRSGPWDGVFCSAKREVGPLQAGMSKSWCVSSTLSWQDTEDPGEDWRPWQRQSHHTGRAPIPDHHEDSCPPKR